MAELFYRDDLVEIWRGDCLEVLPRLAADGLSADLVFADPPYGISRDVRISRGDRVKFKGKDISLFFGEWDVFSGEEEFWEFTFAWADAALGILRPGGMLCSFFDRDKINFLSAYLRKRHGCKPKGYFAWVKTNAVPQARKVKWMNAWEVVGMWQKPGGPLCYNWELGQHPDYLTTSVPGNTAGEDGPRLHPTQKPVRVAELFIAYWTPPGGLVVDPFLGSGTTAVAAKRLGRRCVGVELDEGWCRAAAERCAQRTIVFGPPGGRQGRLEL
jgi:DNA modification methylase